MSIETRTSRLMKKTGVEKSRWTVPLRSSSHLHFIPTPPQPSSYVRSIDVKSVQAGVDDDIPIYPSLKFSRVASVREGMVKTCLQTVAANEILHYCK